MAVLPDQQDPTVLQRDDRRGPGWRTNSRVASRPLGSRIRSTCTEKKLPRYGMGVDHLVVG